MDKDKFLKGLVEGLMFVSQGLKLSDKLFKSLSLLEVINKWITITLSRNYGRVNVVWIWNQILWTKPSKINFLSISGEI